MTQILIPTKYVLNSPVTALHFDEQLLLMLKWARAHESKMVCLANVHMLMEAYWHPEFASVLQAADIVAPDGMPLVWMLRQMGMRSQDRVAGMDVFLRLCQLCSLSDVSVCFVGSQAPVLDSMRAKLEQEFPNLKIAGMEPLPFEPLTPEEDDVLVQKINRSGAGIVLVCLGCPKQEYWMLKHQNKIEAVMIGIGAVFPLYAGVHQRAPQMMRDSGLEWLYRLMQEPKRLWYRYSQTIPPFIILALQQLAAQQKLRLLNQKISVSPSLASDRDSIESELSYLLIDTEPSKLGEILLKQNLVSESILLMALEKQHSHQKKLGEILVEDGYLSQVELDYHLKNQNIKLGELLVEYQILSQVRLAKILKQQCLKLTSKKLGEILLEQKILSSEELRQFLVEQYWRKKGLWLIPDRESKNLDLPRESLSLSN